MPRHSFTAPPSIFLIVFLLTIPAESKYAKCTVHRLNTPWNSCRRVGRNAVAAPALSLLADLTAPAQVYPASTGMWMSGREESRWHAALPPRAGRRCETGLHPPDFVEELDPSKQPRREGETVESDQPGMELRSTQTSVEEIKFRRCASRGFEGLSRRNALLPMVRAAIGEGNGKSDRGFLGRDWQ